MKRITTLILLLFASALAYGQAGYLDKTFGDGGVVEVKLPQEKGMILYDLKVLPDGKIIHCGLANTDVDIAKVYVMKHHSDGRVDSTFGNHGDLVFSFLTSSSRLGMYLYPDGRFLIYGDKYDSYTTLMRPFAARFLQDGTIDSSFGTDGEYIPNASIKAGNFFAIQVHSDSSITALGLRDVRIRAFGNSMYMPTITRITSDGRSDLSFGDSGVKAAGLISDTGVYISAMFRDDSTCVFSRSLDATTSGLNIFATDLNGSIDSSFWHQGRISTQISDGTEYVHTMKFTGMGKLLCIGAYMKGNRAISTLLRFGSDGDMDNSFGEFGIAPVPNDGNDRTAYNIAIDSNGNLIQYGNMFLKDNTRIPVMMHYSPDGNIDSSHGGNGTVQELTRYMNSLSSLVVQADGKYIAGGTIFDLYNSVNRSVLARVNSDWKSVVSSLNENSPTPLSLHPTPSTDNCTITYTLPASGECTMTLRDESGREVRTFATKEHRTAGEHKEELDLRGLAAGVYFLQIEVNGTSQTAKLIKQ